MQKEKEESGILVEELKEKNRELIAEIRRLKGDPQYLQSVARKELGLVRENEVIYRFKKGSNDSGEGSDKRDKNSQK
jgi:cell division protein FtsB